MLALAATKTFIKGLEVFKVFRERRRSEKPPPALTQASSGHQSPAGPQSPRIPSRSTSGLQPSSLPATGRTPPMSPNLSQARRISHEDLRLPSSNVDVEVPRTWSGSHIMPRGWTTEQIA